MQIKLFIEDRIKQYGYCTNADVMQTLHITRPVYLSYIDSICDTKNWDRQLNEFQTIIFKCGRVPKVVCK